MCFSTRKADIFVGVGMFVVRLPTRQMAVIKVLMDDHDRGRAIDYHPFFLTRLVDHPVVPASATNGEVGDVDVAGFGEEEEVGACGAMDGSLTMDPGRQAVLPAFGEFDGLGNIQIPALTQQYKFILQLHGLFRSFYKILRQEHVCVDDAEQVAVITLTSVTRQLEHGRDQRRTVGITRYIWNVFDIKVKRGFSETSLFAKQNDCDVGQQGP